MQHNIAQDISINIGIIKKKYEYYSSNHKIFVYQTVTAH